jgi:hypothetical protein
VAQAIIVLALAVGGLILLVRAGPSTEAMPPGDCAPAAAPTPRWSLRPGPVSGRKQRMRHRAGNRDIP